MLLVIRAKKILQFKNKCKYQPFNNNQCFRNNFLNKFLGLCTQYLTVFRVQKSKHTLQYL